MTSGRLTYILSLLASTSLIAAPFWGAQLMLWWTDLTAAAVFGALGLAMGVYLTIQVRAEQPQTTWQAIWGPLLVVTLMHALALASWSLPAVRQAAVPTLGQQRLKAPLDACLRDDAPGVVASCCQALEPLGAPPQERYARWLERHPEHANLCMVRSINGQSVVANTFARHLITRWEHELLRAKEDAQHSDTLCERAMYLRLLDRLPEAHIGPKLLRCAVSADAEPARYCCAQQLVQLHPNPARDLPSPDSLANAAQGESLLTLLDALLPSPLEREAQDARLERVESIQAHRDALRQWTLSWACHSLPLQSGRPRQQLTTRLALGLLTLCPHDATLLQQPQLPWVHACAQWLQAQPPEPAAQLCHHLQAAKRQDVHDRAALALRRAYQRAYAPHWVPEDPILRAVLKSNRDAPGLDSAVVAMPINPRGMSPEDQTRVILERMFVSPTMPSIVREHLPPTQDLTGGKGRAARR